MFKANVRKSMAIGLGVALVVFTLVLGTQVASAASPLSHYKVVPAASGSSSSNNSLSTAILTLAASIAIAGGLIGTGMAQSGIGAAGMGIIAERPEKFGQVLVFFVIPETLWIIGLVLGFLLLLQIL